MEALKLSPDIKDKQTDAGSDREKGFIPNRDLDEEPIIHDISELTFKYSESGERKTEQVKNQKTVLDYVYQGRTI
ncbi:MAG: hypothetical protein U5K69_17355 [Balneolaceae bacterium]|nr:hypothetical protein [Balneolaceae bacterium]